MAIKTGKVHSPQPLGRQEVERKESSPKKVNNVHTFYFKGEMRYVCRLSTTNILSTQFNTYIVV